MHISEGVLSAPVLVAGALTSLGFVAYGFKKVSGEMLPKTALMASLFFVGSFIHVPLGPASIHLLLNGLVGAVLGVAAFPAILIALLLQALLFQFGGLTTLGINTFNIALPALLAYFLCRRATESSGLVRNIFLFLTGFLPVALSSFFVAVVVALSGDQLMSAAKAIFATHLPLMVVEGIASVFILQFILKVYPSFLDK